jgi:heat shock protein HtpX
MRLEGARNIAKAWLVVGIVAGTAAALGWLLADRRGATLFAFAALLAASAVYAVGDRALLGSLGGRAYALAEDPLLRSTADRIAAQLGVLPPRLYLIDDTFPRAFVVGRGPRSSSLAVSSGLLVTLTPAELDGVIAHELAHVRSRDVLTQTFAVLFAVTLLETTRIGGWLSRALLFVLGPVASAFVHLLLSPKRELAADRRAADALGTGEGLAGALLRLHTASELVVLRASPATEPLYAIDPFDDSRLASLFKTHPPLPDRIARLRTAGKAQKPTARAQ